MATNNWIQQTHGPFEAHVARLDGCALSILGREDW
jgi:hypothetical protein